MVRDYQSWFEYDIIEALTASTLVSLLMEGYIDDSCLIIRGTSSGDLLSRLFIFVVFTLPFSLRLAAHSFHTLIHTNFTSLNELSHL